ncbi:MAG: hypothetical protein ACM34H_11300 [Deltaproteobacteria bacterium]
MIHFIAQPVQAVVMVQPAATSLVAEPVIQEPKALQVVTQELETRPAGKVATRVERLTRSPWGIEG